MKIFWETQCWAGASIVPTGITCLTWMPHMPPHYSASSAQQNPSSHITSFIGIAPSKSRGFLAVGTESGVLGITVTDIADSLTFEEQDLSRRYNYNLRGHHSRIQRCAWNATMTKLASCDENGIIYVWVPNDERWSVELVNDRGLKVRDFNWSPNGSAALILYEDNFVLIGSASGQRIWSNTLGHQVNCGAWVPTSKEFVLGLDNGQIQVYNEQGSIITERQLFQFSIQRLAFSPLETNWTLAVVSASDLIIFMNSSYEVELRSWQSSDPIRMIQWSSSGRMLAVVCKTGNIIILNNEGRLIHRFTPPLLVTEESVISFTWAHNDEVVIVASNGGLSVGRVQPDVPTLNDLISYQIWLGMGRTARDVQRLGLPDRSANLIRQFDRHVVRCRIPSYDRMCRFVCEPTFWRWYCTIVPVPRKNYHYMLCLEHLGGLVPILLGRQVNRVIPQFLISLPPSTAFSTPGYSRGRFAVNAGEHLVGARWDFASNGNPNLPVRNSAFTSDLEPTPPPTIEDPTELCSYTSTVGTEFTNLDEELPYSQSVAQSRNTVWRRSKRQIKKFVSKRISPRSPKASRVLCQVRSNVWCTRFKITSPGIKDLPQTLAQVVYKTSVLHLQPRQMTISLLDLRPLTKTLPIDSSAVLNSQIGSFGSSLMPLQSALTDRRYRSADSSPSETRHQRNIVAFDELEENEADEEERDNDAAALLNNNAEHAAAVVSPMPQQQAVAMQQQADVAAAAPAQQQQQQRLYMTYAATHARLRERRPIQRVPIGQQNAGAPAPAPTQRRTRRSAFRYFRRGGAGANAAAADEQPLIIEVPRPNAPPVAVIESRQAAPAPPSATEERPRGPGSRHVRFHSNEDGATTPRDGASSSPLMEDEKRMYELVRSEFSELCAAVGDKVAQMRSLADELDDLQQQQQQSTSHGVSIQKRRNQFGAQRSATTSDMSASVAPVESLWQRRVDSLEFIDDDGEGPAISASKQNAPTTSAHTSKDPTSQVAKVENPPPAKGRISTDSTSSAAAKKRVDTKLMERLAALAADMRLTHRLKRHTSDDKSPLLLVDEAMGAKSDRQGRDLLLLQQQQHPQMLEMPTSVEQMREHFRDIARKTAQIEETLQANQIAGDLQRRIQRIKSILGETSHAVDLVEPSRAFTTTTSSRSTTSDRQIATFDGAEDSLDVQSERGSSPNDPAITLPAYDVIRVSNKTPFWNDESQVYQLDFGGRVTQESAKNFQIEHDLEQVMQFGRIENGAYTLDFCSPLSAVQAFGIALASITQRLK